MPRQPRELDSLGIAHAHLRRPPLPIRIPTFLGRRRAGSGGNATSPWAPAACSARPHRDRVRGEARHGAGEDRAGPVDGVQRGAQYLQLLVTGER